MKIINQRSQIRTVAERWDRQYPLELYAQTLPSGRPNTVSGALHALDKETATAADVEAIIGNSSWTLARFECDECGQLASEVVEVGEEPDYESATAKLCRSCVEQALAMFKDSP